MVTLPTRRARRRPAPGPRRGPRTTSGRRCARAGVAALLVVAASACSSTGTSPSAPSPSTPSLSGSAATSPADPGPAVRHVPRRFRHLLPGMPPVIGNNVYRRRRRRGRSPRRCGTSRALVYVPDSIADRRHGHGHLAADPPGGAHPAPGLLSQHVIPSYDLRHALHRRPASPTSSSRSTPHRAGDAAHPGAAPVQPLLHPRRAGRRW